METHEIIKWLRDNSSGEHSPAAAAADLIYELLQRFTKLDAVLGTPNADFRAWSRYDLSAARISWEAACKFILANAERPHGAHQA